MWPANLLCLQDHAWMTCQSVITFQRWKNPLHFSNYIWLNWLINRILSESTTYWMGKLTTALLLWLNNNPYTQPLYEMRHSHFKYLLVLAYSLLHSTRANYLVGQNQVNITASDCMSYLFCCFYLFTCITNLPISFWLWQETLFLVTDTKWIQSTYLS